MKESWKKMAPRDGLDNLVGNKSGQRQLLVEFMPGMA
jgi:hypothetical protein